jgi:hypothetical protein
MQKTKQATPCKAKRKTREASRGAYGSSPTTVTSPAMADSKLVAGTIIDRFTKDFVQFSKNIPKF